MRTEYLKEGAYYDCKYRTKQGNKWGNQNNYGNLTRGVAKLVKKSWGYADHLHTMQLPDGTTVFATSNSILKEVKSGAGSALPTSELGEKWAKNLKAIQIESILEDLQAVELLLNGLGVFVSRSEKGILIDPVESQKLELILKECYVNIINGDDDEDA